MKAKVKYKEKHSLKTQTGHIFPEQYPLCSGRMRGRDSDRFSGGVCAGKDSF